MQGKMMHRPLSIMDILKFARDTHGDAEIVSATVEGDIHRQTYRETYTRVCRLGRVLQGLGLGLGDRIATMAWNGYRHFELYYAISGVGAVCHTLNPRLSPDQLIYITHHADDKVLFLDLTFVPIVEALVEKLPKGMRFVVMTDAAHMPDSALDLLCYEDLMNAADEEIVWPELDENTASSLCYTSGTTGNPKGALYSHRSTVLHAMMGGISFQNSLRCGARILPVVPLFHVNAWGLPYGAPMTGASIVFPGPKLDGASIWELMENEAVSSAWGVPTVWLGLLAEIQAKGRRPHNFNEVIIGGSAAPRSMIAQFEDLGTNVCHAWGMTEMSPIGTQGNLDAPLSNLPLEDRLDLKMRQGRRIFGVDLKIVDDQGTALPHDGKSTGELFVRGNAIISGYFENPEASAAAIDGEGWFGTGDVAAISPDGFLQITDRAKDLIKSGGEWISSIDVENMAMSHPSVANCAVIAIAHPKWDERPLLVVVPTDPDSFDPVPVLDYLRRDLAKYQMPDDVVTIDALPLTATGKVSKMTLRERFADYVLPDLRT
jgi:acyl-CoA synthetase (AMP-forming)/AMP-acid ligase II